MSKRISIATAAVALAGLGGGFLAGRASAPDGILRRLDAPKAPVISFDGGALAAEEIGQGGGPPTKAAAEAAGKAAFLALEAERAGLHRAPEFVRRYREELAKLYLEKEFEAPFQKKLPTEAEVRKFFDDHAAQLGRPERVRLVHVAFLAPASDAALRASKRAEAEKALAEARRRAKDEYAFGRIAIQRSEDARSRVAAGELPFMTREEVASRLGPEVVDAAFATQPGRVVERPIETDKGFQLVKVVAHEAGRTASYDEIRDAIRTRLVAERRAQEFRAFMDALWKKADPKYDERALAAATVPKPATANAR